MALDHIVESMLESYDTIGALNHIDGPNLPSRQSIIAIIADLESLIFPGFRDDEPVDRSDLRYTTGEKLARTTKRLVDETEKSLNFRYRLDGIEVDENQCREDAHDVVDEILGQLPEIRRKCKLDVDAAVRGDPAAKSHEEVIVAYPGLEAITVYRIAHELWIRDVPLIPRIMSEYIHGKTGIDIHPGATIGESFFIDHGTGVVIGETTNIGYNVKIYHGVTLGARSVKKEEANVKRHPTIEDDVTIYPGATILGGATVIGRGSIVGGNVWLTSSVPPFNTVYNTPVEYSLRKRNEEMTDYQI